MLKVRADRVKGMKGPEMRADKSGKNQFKKYLGYLAKEYDLYPEKLYRVSTGLLLPQARK